MKEFAARIGKDNFYLIAEITGGRIFAVDTLGITGLDAALGIDEIPDKLEFLAKGFRNPNDYFELVSQLGARRPGVAHLVSEQGRHAVQ